MFQLYANLKFSRQLQEIGIGNAVDALNTV